MTDQTQPRTPAYRCLASAAPDKALDGVVDVAAILAKLPPSCAARHVTDGNPIMLQRGHRGYWPQSKDFDVEGYNTRNNVTAAQVEAMIYGSAFGFDTPAADPDQYILKDAAA